MASEPEQSDSRNCFKWKAWSDLALKCVALSQMDIKNWMGWGLPRQCLAFGYCQPHISGLCKRAMKDVTLLSYSLWAALTAHRCPVAQRCKAPENTWFNNRKKRRKQTAKSIWRIGKILGKYLEQQAKIFALKLNSVEVSSSSLPASTTSALFIY